MYISMSLYMLYFKLISTKNLKKKDFVYYLSLIVFFLISLFLLQSRATIFALIVIVFYESVFNFFKPGKKILKFSIAAIFLTVIFVGISSSERYNSVFTKDSNFSYSKLREKNIRLQLWEKIDVVLENHWLTGVGTGDVKDSFEKVYSKELYNASGGKYLNFHNEFIETTVRLGIPGFIVLFILLLHPLFLRRNYQQNRILIVFTLLIFINFFFESMFVRLYGVLFFALFYCLLNLKDDNGKKFLIV